jgi:succinyl-CoA synthetase alpha subunit
MSVLIDSNTRVVVQGVTGREGGFHTQQMVDYGTPVVAGVTPGKAGTDYAGVPVFDSVADAVTECGANTSIIFVPPPFAGDAICEAAAAGCKLVICITEGLPTLDALRAVKYAGEKGARVIGPNCPGVMTPGLAKIGIMPANIFTKGNVGVVSRSGTLTYEIVALLTEASLGVSTCVGIGGDPVIGTVFVDVLELFQNDPDTKSVFLIGEIGGSDEEMAADMVGTTFTKPIISFISGRSAPPGKRMGHAGAIISGTMGTPQSKVAAFQSKKVPVADTLPDMVRILKESGLA